MSQPNLPSLGGASPKPRRRRVARDAVRGRVRAHDPFELIRWLALSQPDPRKALAELVQNSLDADARRIRVVRLRERGVPCLKIVDDGTGVIPEMEREKALEYIATHVGHSRKRSLSPQERLTLMTQGQYGIGLLGFWSLGNRLEIRSSVPGQVPRRLVLHRDDPHYEIEPLRGRLALDERFTEIVVVGLHRDAMAVLVGRRAADYLGSELRGQILGRDVELTVEDRMSRGTAPKQITVRPPRFLGERIPGLDHVDVPNHPPIRLEIYLATDDATGGEPRGLSLYAAGTLVADSFAQLGTLELDRAPWTDLRLTGLVDFPGFRVAPGSRRGVLLDEAGAAFARALSTIEPVLAGMLEALDRQRAEKLDRTMVRDLQRAFRDFYRQRPSYAMLPVHDARDLPAGAGSGNASGDAAGVVAAMVGAANDAELAEIEIDEPISLLPPGPLEAVRLVPSRLRVECSAAKRIRAMALDSTGRLLEEEVTFDWYLEGELGTLSVSAERSRAEAQLTASALPVTGTIAVVARANGREARAVAPVEVVDDLASSRPDEGIPEPEFVSNPGAAWRSRMHEGRWQVNLAHRDYSAIADSASLKLRYLAMLFAKEIVIRSHSDPRLDSPLEQLIEVAAFADRNITAKHPGRLPRGRSGRPKVDPDPPAPTPKPGS